MYTLRISLVDVSIGKGDVGGQRFSEFNKCFEVRLWLKGLQRSLSLESFVTFVHRIVWSESSDEEIRCSQFKHLTEIDSF